jgi:predicted transcriptional regulator
MQKAVKKNISIRLNPATQKALEKLAWAEKRTRSAMIEVIVASYLQVRGRLK